MPFLCGGHRRRGRGARRAWTSKSIWPRTIPFFWPRRLISTLELPGALLLSKTTTVPERPARAERPARCRSSRALLFAACTDRLVFRPASGKNTCRRNGPKSRPRESNDVVTSTRGASCPGGERRAKYSDGPARNGASEGEVRVLRSLPSPVHATWSTFRCDRKRLRCSTLERLSRNISTWSCSHPGVVNTRNNSLSTANSLLPLGSTNMTDRRRGRWCRCGDASVTSDGQASSKNRRTDFGIVAVTNNCWAESDRFCNTDMVSERKPSSKSVSASSTTSISTLVRESILCSATNEGVDTSTSGEIGAPFHVSLEEARRARRAKSACSVAEYAGLDEHATRSLCDASWHSTLATSEIWRANSCVGARTSALGMMHGSKPPWTCRISACSVCERD